jgi:2-polyprenyl-3-methyl-5-hydroxy-6-metoxy-1,4-benzoquinol methylase
MRIAALVAIAALVLPATALTQMMPPMDQSASVGEQWDQRYDMERYIYGTEPVVFLVEQIDRLPKGTALCLAAGEGRNAVWLAQQGYDVTAIDVSPIGLEKAVALAEQRGVRIETEVGDLQGDYDMGIEQYDLITNFYYHDTAMIPAVMRALRPGGAFVLQNFSIDQLETNQFGPRNPDFLVKPNELLEYFADYRVLHYEDRIVELDEGMHQGPGAVVRLIVVKESP